MVANPPALGPWVPITPAANVGIWAGIAGGSGVVRAAADSLGIVHLDGWLTATATVTAGLTICTLPAGLRPPQTRLAFPWNSVGLFSMQANGICVLNADWTIGNVLVLDGITFPLS